MTARLFRNRPKTPVISNASMLVTGPAVDHRSEWFHMGTIPLEAYRSLRILVLFITAFLSSLCTPVFAHDLVTTPVTWNREMSRIFYSRCVACHREGGMAFSMTEYPQTFPWRTAIKEEILERRMPPWGAVKGFGDFRNDQALTPEQLELITSWSAGGSPEGKAEDLLPKDKLEELLKDSVWPGSAVPEKRSSGEIVAKGDFKLTKEFVLDGLFPRNVPADGSFQIIAELPDGRVEPLLWLDGYKEQFAHVFLYRAPIELPAGTVITGIPSGSSIVFLPSQGN